MHGTGVKMSGHRHKIYASILTVETSTRLILFFCGMKFNSVKRCMTTSDIALLRSFMKFCQLGLYVINRNTQCASQQLVSAKIKVCAMSR